MKKQNLLTGDIVVTRGGELGVVLTEKEYILYQNEGLDFLDMFTEELLSKDGEKNWDIMKVYRGDVISFFAYEDEEPIFEREEVECGEMPKETKCFEEVKQSDDIFIIMQAFYGNRTGMSILKEDLDSLILGYVDKRFMGEEPVDRTIVKIPNTENLVLIYNKYQEERKLKKKERLLLEDNVIVKPVAFIPEENIEIYSRCAVCRMNENGDLESLQDGDGDKILKYLAQ